MSYKVDNRDMRFTDPFIAKLTDTTLELARGGLHPMSDAFIAKLAAFTVGGWFSEQMGGARIRREDIDLMLDIVAVVTAVLMRFRSLAVIPPD